MGSKFLWLMRKRMERKKKEEGVVESRRVYLKGNYFK